MRRTLLGILLAFLLLPAHAQQAELRSGPMLGYSAQRAVAVWVQTTAPAEVQIRYWTPDRPDSSQITPVLQTTREGDLIAEFDIAYLDPGTKYDYEVVIDGRTVRRPYPLQFQTQELWQWRREPPEFVVALGSCAYVNDTIYDRPGDPYGGGYGIFETIAAMDPDVMLWLGDNVYYRESDWDNPEMMSYRYAHTRQLPEMQALLGHTHNYAIWDDHDYGPNNSNRSYYLKGAALDIFEQYWANPTYGLPDAPGAFTKFTWGGVDFFLLDDRYYRAPNDAPTDGKKTMLGEEQLQWLIDALATSDTPFKMVVIGGQVLNDRNDYEGYARFPAEKQRIVDAIVERQIEGVLFLTGDRHHTELLRQDIEGGYPLYDFTNSPLTAGPGTPRGREADNPMRIDETLVTERNFGTLTFSGPRADRMVHLRTYDKEGDLLWEEEVRARDLTFDRE